MQKFKDLLEFLKKNRLIIYVIFGMAIMLQICSKGAETPIKNPSPVTENVHPLIQNPSVDVNNPNLENQNPGTDLQSLLLIAIVVLGFFVAKRYGWIEKLYPKVVIFRVSFYKVRLNGKLALKVVLINHTKRDITFNNPSIQFFKGKDKREFSIKNIGGQNYFPITLLPNTGHKFTIDAQKFYDQVEGLSEHRSIRMVISATDGTSYKSIKWPIALTYKKL